MEQAAGALQAAGGKRMGRVGWGLLLVLAECLMGIGFGLFVVARFLPEGTDIFTPNWVGAGFLVVMAPLTAWLLVAQGAVKRGGVSWSELGWRSDRLGPQIGLGVLGFFAAALASFAPAVLFGVATPGELLDGIRQWTWVDRGYFALIGLQAAFIEESIFRGYLQPALCSKLGLVGGVLLTAAIFAVYHLNPRPFALLGKVGVGLVYGLLRGRDRSLVAPAISHALVWMVVGAL